MKPASTSVPKTFRCPDGATVTVPGGWGKLAEPWSAAVEREASTLVFRLKTAVDNP